MVFPSFIHLVGKRSRIIASVSLRKSDFVIEEQEWKQSDPEGWLVKARERLQQLGVSPILSVPHPEFAVRGFCRFGHDSRHEPTLWLLTLSDDVHPILTEAATLLNAPSQHELAKSLIN